MAMMTTPTPEQLDAGAQGIAMVLTAIGVLITAIISAVAAWRSGKALETATEIKDSTDKTLATAGKTLEKAVAIEKSTNGAVDAAAAVRLALETKIDGLKGELLAAKVSADDVRAGIAAEPLARTGRDG